MKERPILFSAPMIRALLAGTKTQTRRAVTHPVLEDLPEIVDQGAGWWGDGDGRFQARCPYGQPGDRLWVREAWYCDHWNVQRGPYLEVSGAKDLLYYRATDCDGSGATYTGFSGETMCNPWRPSIHMPRWASRITREIVSIRVERLNDISEADAWAEGCMPGSPTDNGGFFPAEEPDPSGIGERGWDCALDWYADLWELINGPRSWAANPWVWVVDFASVP